MQEEVFVSILNQCSSICLVMVLSVSALIQVSRSPGKELNQTSQIRSKNGLLSTALHHEKYSELQTYPEVIPGIKMSLFAASCVIKILCTWSVEAAILYSELSKLQLISL
jgi:hypothetical protein